MEDQKKDQKALWQKEKEQLKTDLANRQKKIQKNPVSLKFGHSPAVSKSNLTKKPTMDSKQNNSLPDNFLRRQIGLI